MIPHARQIFGTKGVHAVSKVFETWIWVRKRGGTGDWRLKRIMKNVSGLYHIFYVSIVQFRKPTENLPLPLMGEARNLPFTALDLSLLNIWQTKH